MRTYKVSTKIKGIARVSFSNLLSLAVSLITSFILPYFISVEDYGYWQLFILYAGYAGFFAFGFNDGIHLNYATNEFNKETAKKFHSFKTLLLVVSAIETVILYFLLTIVLSSESEKYYVFLFTILNIIPVLLNGMFTYLNQGTMRFKQYALGNIIDKLIFAAVMVVMLLCGVRNYIFYIAAYTAARYMVIVYHYCTSRAVFIEKAIPLNSLKPEVIRNFKSGFALMVATLLNGSIIVGSRLLIEQKFGIADFGAYSFANHTLVIASQFISAIASVFYPIMKRCRDNEQEKVYNTFDKSSTLLTSLLLTTYYVASILIYTIYKQYSTILAYFTFVYPLFIFQCKSNLLIINEYKVKGKPLKLIARNALGVVLHIIFSFSAYYIFGTIKSIAIAVLISYCIWYYISQVKLYRESDWRLNKSMFTDLIIVFMFIAINTVVNDKLVGDFYKMVTVQSALYIATLAVIGIISKHKIKATLHEAAYILND